MWSEKRGIESYIIFAILPIMMHIGTNVMYFISEGSYETLKYLEEVNKSSIFFILICCFFNFFEKSKKLSKDEKKELNKKMLVMNLLNIVFIGYIIFAIIIVKNITVITSALIMYVGYINLYMFKSKSKRVVILSETQKNWRKTYNTHSYEESSLLWKIKPMLVPHVSVSFNERIKYIDLIGLIFILPFLGLGEFRLVYIPLIIIFSLFIIPDALYPVDAILGLYTETEGICTGVVMKMGTTRSRGYHEVYVTDFLNKREIKFRVYDYCNYNENDVVKVIHGGLSKRVLKAKIVSNNFM